jgi:tetratricopeptide (TPR) repeat protein
LRNQLGFHESARGYAQLALAERLQGGTHESAMQWIERSLALDPLLPTAYAHRGVLLLMQGRQEEARRDFQHVLQLDPGHVQARQALDSLNGGR